jgi:glycogen synthase
MEWRDPVEWRERMRRAMCKDYSWGASASRYSQLYARLLSS